MKYSYDEKFNKIKFYNIHNSYLPFIGDNYENYKILFVGESHYINQKEENIKFNTQYFHEHWWEDECNEVFKDEDNLYRCNTRKIIEMYCSKENINKEQGKMIPYAIYDNVLSVFERVYKLGKHNREYYNCFAFMNFFQMPALVYGYNIEESLEICDGNNWKKDKDTVWGKVCRESIGVFDKVVNIINPKLIVFTSSTAHWIYTNRESEGKLKEDNRIQKVVHPGCAWWNRDKGKYGWQKLENILKHYKEGK